MFGKKKKKLEAERREEELRLQQQQELQMQQQEAAQKQEDKIFLESELVDDDEDDNALPKEYEAIAYILKQEQGEDLVAEPVDDQSQPEQAPVQSVEEVKPSTPAEDEASLEPEQAKQDEQSEQSTQTEVATEETEDVSDKAEDESEEIEDSQTDVADQSATEEQKEEVVYVVDGPSEEDDEIVKPAKLVKLPNLVDYMLSQNMSKQMKINIATLLLSAYNKYKDVPAEKKIVIQCMAKVMKSLIQG